MKEEEFFDSEIQLNFLSTLYHIIYDKLRLKNNEMRLFSLET